MQRADSWTDRRTGGTVRLTDGQTDGQGDSQTDRWTDSLTAGQPDRQRTGRPVQWQTDRVTGRLTD
jgi:hypothetical protein